ncbi:hypothetical protein F5Y09DRAFT_316867 [Xylaria sp. FL1042]|nr:hypothetical protein F5Y09DRAFT_316867 [Xylaria sp. FL1042]
MSRLISSSLAFCRCVASCFGSYEYVDEESRYSLVVGLFDVFEDVEVKVVDDCPGILDCLESLSRLYPVLGIIVCYSRLFGSMVVV